MNTTIFIPKTLKIGYQTKDDTATGKLAYVTYEDENGEIRKRKSWENWRSNQIPTDTFDNNPQAGFVINKSVGGHKSRWDYRQAYCRILDPRGFEFEITIESAMTQCYCCNLIQSS